MVGRLSEDEKAVIGSGRASELRPLLSDSVA